MPSKVKAAKLQTVSKTITDGPTSIEVETRPADPIEMVPNVSVPAVVVKSEEVVGTRQEKKAAKPKTVAAKKEAPKPVKLPAKKQVVQAKETVVVSPNKVVEKPAVETKKPTVSQSIWNEIKDRKLSLFGLAGFPVEHYCRYVPLDPNRCFLAYDISAVLPALEGVAPEYEFELITKYIVLTKRF